MGTFDLKILATNKVFYDGKCKMLVVPALDGELAVMANHQNMVVATTIGDIRFQEAESDEWHTAIVGIGFVHIANNRVTMLVDTAERPEDIDAARAREAYERALEQLQQKQSIQEYQVALAALARAMHRLKKSTRQIVD